MDLFTPVVESRRLHHNFVVITRDSEASERKVITEWATGFVDRDGKFVREFQTRGLLIIREKRLLSCQQEA